MVQSFEMLVSPSLFMLYALSNLHCTRWKHHAMSEISRKRRCPVSTLQIHTSGALAVHTTVTSSALCQLPVWALLALPSWPTLNPLIDVVYYGMV